MNKFRALAVLAILSIGLTSAACGPGSVSQDPAAGAGSHTMAGPAAPAGPFPYHIDSDEQFIDLMVPHHQLAIDMARIAEVKAQHGELKGLARDIIKDQEDEIARMSIWRGGTVTPAMEGHAVTPGAQPMPGMSVDLNRLAASPSFDLDFIRAMIPHHESAIGMAKAAMPNLKRREVADLAQDIIAAQTTEITRMQKWLKEW